jgi:glycosyltransferase involved in cell wall biosynthesis
MRRYLFIAANEWNNWGGSELLWSLTAEKLARRGSDVRVSFRSYGTVLREVERVRSAGGHIFQRRPSSFLARQTRRIFHLSEYSLSHLCTVGKDVDLLVISQGAVADGLGWMEAAAAAKIKYVVIVQCASETHWPDDAAARRLATGFENAAVSYFVSQSTLDLTRRQIGTPLRRGKVIRNPFNVPYDANPPWPTDFAGEINLACIARLDAGQKGQDLLLGVLSLPHWRTRNVRLALVGRGQNEKALKSMAQSLELNNVEFLGHQFNVEDIWTNHHALVLPSRFEGMPLVVVEAMLCGRACIATDVAGSRELIRDGVNGFLARAPTVEMLDEAMNRAWDNRTQLKAIGSQAAKDVRQFVSRDPAEDFVRELESLVDGHVGQK